MEGGKPMGHHESNYEPKWGIAKWFDERLPVARMVSDQFIVFPTPRNLNYWWTMEIGRASCRERVLRLV